MPMFHTVLKTGRFETYCSTGVSIVLRRVMESLKTFAETAIRENCEPFRKRTSGRNPVLSTHESQEVTANLKNIVHRCHSDVKLERNKPVC